MIYRRLTKFFNVAIFWVVIRISEKFSVRAPKCRSDDKHNNTKGETVIQRHLTVYILQIGHLFWVVMGLGEHFIIRAQKCCLNDKFSKTGGKR